MSPWQGERGTPFYSVGLSPTEYVHRDESSPHIPMALRHPHLLPDVLSPWSPSTHLPLQPGTVPGPPYLGHT